MIRKANECPVDVRHEMRGGPGDVTMVALLKEEELLGKGRLFSKIILPPGAGIGYHVHENESEIFLVNKGTPLYNDNGKERTVAEGDVLVVLEAMKMEIEVKAPKAGTVQSVLVAPGDKVVNGTPLVTLG